MSLEDSMPRCDGWRLKRFLYSSDDFERERAPLLGKKGSLILIPKRYIFSLMMFVACSLAVSFNMNLSIAIVSMIDRSEILPRNFSEFMMRNVTPADLNGQVVRYNWSSDIESTALGAVYYGQMVSFIPGGRMAELWGGKKMLLLCTTLSSLFTLLSPVFVQFHVYAFIASRFIIGLGTGPVIPIITYLLARWIPVTERSFHIALILAGYGVGSFLAVIVSGVLCGTTFLGGWPSVFYTGGFCGLLWCVCGIFIIRETPDEHPTISENERIHILNHLDRKEYSQISPIPWKEIITSVPFWALAVGFFGQFWLLGFFSTVHAVYMGTVLELPVVENGELSCLPHLMRAIAAVICGYYIDIALKKKMVSVGFVRKGATAINTLVSCSAFLGITMVGHDAAANAALFVLGGMLGEFVTFGVCMGCMDIAPDLTGTVSGIINIIGVFPFFMIPALVGWITDYEKSIFLWKKVFYATIGVTTCTTLLFIVFGDLNPQPWGTAHKSKVENEEANQNKEAKTCLVSEESDESSNEKADEYMVY